MYQRQIERTSGILARTPRQKPDRLGRAFRAVEAVTAVGVLLGGLELLRVRKTYTDESLNSWPITRTRLYRLAPPRGRAVDAAVRYPHVLVVAGARAASGAALLLPGLGPAARAAALAGAVGSGALLHLRTNYGNDGSDHLATISLSASLIEKGFSRDAAVRRAALGFIAAQSTLSYVTSGATKLRSPIWRSGEALTGVMRTRTYGDGWLYRLLRDRPRLTRLAGWAVMLFEVAFPLVFVLPTPLSRALLGGAAFFHVLNARFMGLNRFLWAFVGSYPAVIYFADLVGRRIDEGAPRNRRRGGSRRVRS